MNSTQIAELLVDYFDMDIQIYSSKVLEQLRETENGHTLAEWVQAHPSAFKMVLRLASVAVQRFPHNRGLVLATIKQHLSRLPADAYRIFGESKVAHPPLQEMTQETYEEILGQHHGDDLLLLSTLPRDKLGQWSDSTPQKRLRLMDSWVNRDRQSEGFLSKLYEGLKKVPDDLLDIGESLVPDVEEGGLFRRIFRRELSMLGAIWSKLIRKGGA